MREIASACPRHGPRAPRERKEIVSVHEPTDLSGLFPCALHQAPAVWASIIMGLSSWHVAHPGSVSHGGCEHLCTCTCASCSLAGTWLILKVSLTEGVSTCALVLVVHVHHAPVPVPVHLCLQVCVHASMHVWSVLHRGCVGTHRQCMDPCECTECILHACAHVMHMRTDG